MNRDTKSVSIAAIPLQNYSFGHGRVKPKREEIYEQSTISIG